MGILSLFFWEVNIWDGMNNKYNRLTFSFPERAHYFQDKNIFILTNQNQGYKSRDKM